MACSAKPLDVPANETKPAARPCASVRDTRNSMLGPGVAASATQAAQNNNQVSSGIIAVPPWHLRQRSNQCPAGPATRYHHGDRGASSNALDCERRRFAAADAKRGDAARLVLLAQRAEQRH